jgi:hypothetical protein
MLVAAAVLLGATQLSCSQNASRLCQLLCLGKRACMLTYQDHHCNLPV